MSLTLFNPYLIYTNENERQAYLEAVQQNEKFTQLVSVLNEAFKTDAEKVLDYDTNPAVYQLAAQLMKETMVSLGGGGAFKPAISIGEPPYIEEAQGSSITFVNPRYVWYSAGIYPNEGSLDDVVTIPKMDDIISVDWGWPPQITSNPSEVDYALGNGYYKIYITKKFDYSKFSQWGDPVGRATICNTAQTLVYLIELVIGNMNYFDETLIVSFPQHFNISTAQSYDLALAIGEGDAGEFLINFTNITLTNLDEVSNWIWQGTETNASKVYLGKAMEIFKNVSVALKLLGYTDEQAPFFRDLLFAPGDVTYFITQENETITETEENNAPQPAFNFTPTAGVVGTTFTFDASNTTDDIDELAELSFRWDWESDGTWDTQWTTNYTATYQYNESGAYVITLESKDSGGLTDHITHTVNIGGGLGTASHIKLFRDNLPWGSNATVDVLESLGFTNGNGADTYEIISSDQMASVSLIPGVDLVIICNDQNQTFYNNYSANQLRFTNFVNNGGSMLWEACDMGWALGSISKAGIVLPGNITTSQEYQYNNYVLSGELPLLAGLPQSMDHNYASHESFSNYPDGTTVYMVNEDNNPTLIEFNLGLGWIIMSGQPLEHQYDRVYNQPDMEKLLPRIVAYFTGKPLEDIVARITVLSSEIPSGANK